MSLRIEKGPSGWLIMDGLRHFATVYGTESEAKAFIEPLVHHHCACCWNRTTFGLAIAPEKDQ